MSQLTIASWVVGVIVVPINIWIWSVAFRRVARGEHAIDLQPRWLVPWGLVDVIGAIVVSIFFGPVAIKILESVTDYDSQTLLLEQPLKLQLAALFALSCGSLLAGICTVVVIRIRVGAELSDFGLPSSWKEIRQDLIIGVIGFFALVVPVLTIQFALNWAWDTETKHPIVMALKENPDQVDALFWGVIIWVAVIVAPVFEELLIRVIFQGWLENIASGKLNEFEILSGLHARFRKEPVPDLPSFDDELAEISEHENEPATHQYHEPKLIKTWPIFCSSLLFAMLHWNHGPDPYPLFVLAVGLGYIYHTTHRILPCIVVHMMINLTSVAGMYLAHTFGEIAPKVAS